MTNGDKIRAIMQEVRLIDANAAADKIMRGVETHADEIGIGGTTLMIAFARAMRDETDFPTIEAEPVRHGVWNDDHEEVVCSICKSEFDYEMLIFIANGIEAEYVDGMTCRCPKCGSYNRYGEPPESEVQ